MVIFLFMFGMVVVAVAQSSIIVIIAVGWVISSGMIDVQDGSVGVGVGVINRWVITIGSHFRSSCRSSCRSGFRSGCWSWSCFWSDQGGFQGSLIELVEFI